MQQGLVTQAVSNEFVSFLWALLKLVLLASLLERGLYFIFDYTKWRKRLEGKGIRAPIALGAAWVICWYYEFDILAALLQPDSPTALGFFVTATIVSGGSAAAMVLFQSVLRLNREGMAEIDELRKKRHEAESEEMDERKKKAVAGTKKVEAEANKADRECSGSKLDPKRDNH